jgi:serine/threonine-protein kinase
LYWPPEQARGELEHIDRRADVFALGAILCEILTGQSPYLRVDETLTAPGLASQLLDRTQRGDVSAGLERLGQCVLPWQALAELARVCLAVSPADRPADASFLVATVNQR